MIRVADGFQLPLERENAFAGNFPAGRGTEKAGAKKGKPGAKGDQKPAAKKEDNTIPKRQP